MFYGPHMRISWWAKSIAMHFVVQMPTSWCACVRHYGNQDGGRLGIRWIDAGRRCTRTVLFKENGWSNIS
jgi:hypothetical protein